MTNIVQSLRKHVQSEFAQSAVGYLRIGLRSFFESNSWPYLSAQAALGNLGIAVELMLKSFLAARDIQLIYKNLPFEAQAFLSAFKDLPPSFPWRTFEIAIRSGRYETIGFDESRARFYVFVPELKQSLESHLRFLSQHRNAAVHSVFPSFQRFELEKVAFAALTIVQCLMKSEQFRYTYVLTDEDRKFLDQFRADRIDRVKRAVEKSKKHAATIEHTSSCISVDEWGLYVTECPICGCDGILYGDTEHGFNEDNEPFESLDFFAYEFHCDECGLALEDNEELRLAGMETCFDRTGELNKWRAQFAEF